MEMLDLHVMAGELKALAEKYGVFLTGRLRVLQGDTWESSSFKVESLDTVSYGKITDRGGPFFEFGVDEKPQEPVIFTRAKAHNISSDYGVYDCPVTGEMIEGRYAHRENLKSKGCRLLEKGEHEHNEKSRREAIDHDTERLTDKVLKEVYQQL